MGAGGDALRCREEMPQVATPLQPMCAAFLKGDAGTGDEIGHRARDENFAGGCMSPSASGPR